MIKDRILKTEKTDWRKFKFLQSFEFKEITERQKQKLKNSILRNNFVETFKVWQDGKDIYCLDGFHRINYAFKELEEEGEKIPDKLTANFIDCKNKKEAGELTLVYSSLYATITESGFIEYLEKYKLDYEALKESVNIPELDSSEDSGEDEANFEKGPDREDEFSIFELIMLNENKRKLAEILTAVKDKYKYEKTEDALMYIINKFKL